MEFDPTQARDSAVELDALAARLEEDLRVDAADLHVEPAGVDEVSGRAAHTLTDAAASYDEAAVAGILEIRKLAAALRSQTDQMLRMDGDNAGAFGMTG